ncbi:MAG: LacI family DNA-binding transcriptional regulator, partial [Lachnospiraceae bacterium]|nr:LacI family DNA-binding transcriptional regulator [Lachnospiraceae bacterium]
MNINEIANLAGVSRATVSRYLNEGYVSQEKREKIQKVIEQTGYRPLAQAQTMRTRKTHLVGVIIPKINSDSISLIVKGITKVLSEEGYQMLLANTDNNEKEELRYLNIFQRHQVDGILLLGTILTREHQAELKKLKVPLVLLGQEVKQNSCDYHDDYNAMKDLTEQ